ncbi:hypothetical protein M8J77_010363 [Diaphorina citri]|nr:hypothetical protein M8J77_010363 [Diaphorina citri]
MAFSSQPEATLTNILQEMRNLSTGIAEIKTSQDRLEPQASQSSTPTAGQRTNVTQSRIERFFPREDLNRKDP